MASSRIWNHDCPQKLQFHLPWHTHTHKRNLKTTIIESLLYKWPNNSDNSYCVTTVCYFGVSHINFHTPAVTLCNCLSSSCSYICVLVTLVSTILSARLRFVTNNSETTFENVNYPVPTLSLHWPASCQVKRSFKSKLISIALTCLYTIRIYTIHTIQHWALIIRCRVPCLYIGLSSHVHGAKGCRQNRLITEFYVASKVLHGSQSSSLRRASSHLPLNENGRMLPVTLHVAMPAVANTGLCPLSRHLSL